jgi:putative transposase
MPRIARAVAPGYPHHVTQRGNYQQPVFETEEDYCQYLSWLKDYSTKYGLNIWAYCLMSNHVHYVCVPEREDSLSKTFNALHMRYSQYVNQKKGARGHLWQGRFFSCILDERHLYASIRYVENNPVRAGIVEGPEHYRWSSARGHIGTVTDPVLAYDCYLEKELKNWLEYLKQKEDNQFVDDIRKSSMSGRPCGDESFIGKMEGLLNRRLHALPWGRPRRETQ